MEEVSGWMLLWITFQTVAKVLLVASAGYVTARRLTIDRNSTEMKKNREQTNPNFSAGCNYIATMIMLPCMLFVHMSKTVSFSLLCEFYWAPLLSAVTLLYGYAYSTMLCNWFLAPNDAAIVQLQGMLPSAIPFPLAVLVSLRGAGLPWMQESGYEAGETYMFLFTTVVSLSIWAIATHIVRATQEIEMTLKGLPQSDDDQGANNSWFSRYIRPSLQPPLLGLLSGIVVGVIPWKSSVMETGVGRVLWGGLDLLGAGAVPLILFLLGFTVAGSSSAEPDSSLSMKVVTATCLVRLFLVPATMLLTIHALSLLQWLPNSPVLKLVLLVEAFSPSAINTTVVCTQRGYRVKDVRKNLFCVYITAIPVATLWLMAVLSYISLTI